jgi:tRNA G18 (ribose-2'-O)-methylase SpoU
VSEPITLVGDGIENPFNARVLLRAAELFGLPCLFRDRKKLVDAWPTVGSAPLPQVNHERLASEYRPLILCDNLPGASPIYGFRPPSGARPALVVGNERRGIADDLRSLASCAVEIPLAAGRLNTLNVAAAAAVALYYLSRPPVGAARIRTQPAQRRPALLLLGATDHVELGSAIRSAGAFGWGTILVDDRSVVWFGCDRARRTEGRAAARRARNPIRLVRSGSDQRYAHEEAVVVLGKSDGPPLQRLDLAGGARQLIVLPDESGVDVDQEDWDRLARRVRFGSLDLRTESADFPYRLTASIALAEIARQVGFPSGGRPGRRPRFPSELELEPVGEAETVHLDELKESY